MAFQMIMQSTSSVWRRFVFSIFSGAYAGNYVVRCGFVVRVAFPIYVLRTIRNPICSRFNHLRIYVVRQQRLLFHCRRECRNSMRRGGMETYMRVCNQLKPVAWKKCNALWKNIYFCFCTNWIKSLPHSTSPARCSCPAKQFSGAKSAYRIQNCVPLRWRFKKNRDRKLCLA